MTGEYAEGAAVSVADAFERLAVEVAEVMGVNVILGARPYRKGWFAHCDGVEVDASNPTQALNDLIGELRRRESTAANSHFEAQEKAEARFTGLINAYSNADPKGATDVP